MRYRLDRWVTWSRPAGVGAAVLFLTACATQPPAGLDVETPDAPGQREAQTEPAAHRGKQVRWGGEILAVVNKPRSTEIEVFGRPLEDNAEPRPDGGEGVRFIAVLPGFLDPADYQPGKRLTVLGRLDGLREQAVGDYPYPYPLVDAEAYHLWPVYVEPYPPAYWNYPYYDPWWPWWGPYRRWPHYW
jgi:outer membrane lipoprotein